MREKNKGFSKHMRGGQKTDTRTLFKRGYKDNCHFGDVVEFTAGGISSLYPEGDRRLLSGTENEVLLDSEGYSGYDAEYYIKRNGEWL